MAFIGSLCVILAATTLLAHFAKRIGIPAVIGQLLVGILLGKSGLNVIHSGVLVDEFSEIGVILLMFIAGLESDLSLLKKYLHPGILVAGFGMGLPLFASWLTGILFHLRSQEALFLGITLAATSVSISVEVLKEMNVLQTKEGATILGASVIDDILTVLLVSVSMAFLTKGSVESTLSFLDIVEPVLYFLFIFIVVRWIAPLLIELSSKLFVTSSVIIVSLFLCLTMAYLAEWVGLSAVIGAFFAGIAVGQTKGKEKVHFNIEALGYAVFIPVFFVSIGLEVSFSQLSAQFAFIVMFVIIAILTKLWGGFIGAKFSHFENNSAFMIGAGMVSRGEMALIILQLGQGNHLISSDYYGAMVIIILMTTLLSPLILKYYVQKIEKAGT